MSLTVRDLARSRAFYEAALASVGHARVVEVPDPRGGDVPAVGFCHADGSDLWLRQGEPTSPLHLAFRAPDRAAVDAFHAAALAAGGRDNGAPGPRPHDHASDYGAFVLDPDGHNVEAVCHEAP